MKWFGNGMLFYCSFIIFENVCEKFMRKVLVDCEEEGFDYYVILLFVFLLRKWFIYENVLIIWEFFDEFFLKNDIFEYIVWYEIIVGFFFCSICCFFYDL